MPRPVLPAVAGALVSALQNGVQSVPLDKRQRREIAQTLGRQDLSEEIAGVLGHILGVYRTERAARDPGDHFTPRAVAARLREIAKLLRSAKPVRVRKGRTQVARIVAQPSPLDHMSWCKLKQIVESGSGEPGYLSRAIDSRASELDRHPPVRQSAEEMRLFLGCAELIFRHFATDQADIRKFALTMLETAGLEKEAATFRTNPKRLDGMLGTPPE